MLKWNLGTYRVFVAVVQSNWMRIVAAVTYNKFLEVGYLLTLTSSISVPTSPSLNTSHPPTESWILSASSESSSNTPIFFLMIAQSLLSMISFFSYRWLEGKDKRWKWFFSLSPSPFPFDSSKDEMNSKKLNGFDSCIAHLEKFILPKKKKNPHQLFG